MIEILGTKRMLRLGALLGVNLLLALILYAYLLPDSKKVDMQMRSLQNQVFEVESDIEKMQIDLQTLKDQEADFDKLKNGGFFQYQSRRDAQNLIEEIQKESSVITSSASIDPGKIVENDEAAKAGRGILVSPMKVSIDAYDDLDIYKYLELLQEKFPGKLSIERIEVSRLVDLSSTILRGIAGGENIPLVSAEVFLTWRTMVDEKGDTGAEE